MTAMLGQMAFFREPSGIGSRAIQTMLNQMQLFIKQSWVRVWSIEKCWAKVGLVRAAVGFFRPF